MKQITITLTTVIILIFSTLTITAQLETKIPNEVHLQQNPYNPMNILLVPANIDGITPQQGDLVMAFAGKICAGAAMVEDVSTILNLVATSTDEVNKGYKSGQAIRLEYHSTYDNTVYELIPTKILMGSMNYEELGTFYAEFKANALSIEEHNSDNIKVYPNPVSQQLHIVLELGNIAQHKNIKLQLINISGAVVIEKQFTLNQSVINLDVAGLPTGEYTLVVVDDDMRFVRKVIKR